MSSILLGRPFRLACGPLLIAVTVCASAAFAVRVARGLADERIDPSVAARPTAPVPASARSEAAGDHGAALVGRNMFCSTCVGGGPDQPLTPAADGRPRPWLIATHVGAENGDRATLVEDSGVGGSFPIGATVGGVTLVSVARGSVVVRFPDGALATIRPGLDGRPPGKRAVAASAAGDAPWADRIRLVGADRYEVDRRLIRELMGSGAGGQVKGVRVVPVIKEGDVVGLLLATARDGSLARALGLAQGDVIESIDGRPLTPDLLMDTYGRMGELQRIAIGVDRRGAKKTLGYELR